MPKSVETGGNTYPIRRMSSKMSLENWIVTIAIVVVLALLLVDTVRTVFRELTFDRRIRKVEELIAELQTRDEQRRRRGV